jgi:hypothetical protein
LQFNSVLDLLTALVKHVVEALGLGHGTGETVKNESALISTSFILAICLSVPHTRSGTPSWSRARS